MAWQEDSMVKVFQEPGTPVKAHQAIPLHAARNEVISAQVVITAPKDATDLTCKIAPLAGPGGAKISALQIRYVGYVPVKKNSDDHAIHPTGDFPDPLLESPPPLKAGKLQPIWLTIRVPKDAAPGEYTGKVEITATGLKAD